jgi:predicted GNAT family N-acyltransferase
LQIRIGNKQDEPACRELAKGVAAEAQLVFDLETTDSDLKNIESTYLGHDGIFLVAEEEQEIIAFATAGKGESEEQCKLSRVCVATAWRRKGIGKKLVEQVIFFAKNLDYREVQVRVDLKQSADPFLSSLGFVCKGEEEGSSLYLRSSQASSVTR